METAEFWPRRTRRAYADEVTYAAEYKLEPNDVLILKGLSYGCTEEQVAGMLGQTVPAVNQRMKHIRYHLAAKNQAEAVANALRHQIIT
jgi:DNA-binding NarL/FixJ family response regulator